MPLPRPPARQADASAACNTLPAPPPPRPQLLLEKLKQWPSLSQDDEGFGRRLRQLRLLFDPPPAVRRLLPAVTPGGSTAAAAILRASGLGSSSSISSSDSSSSDSSGSDSDGDGPAAGLLHPSSGRAGAPAAGGAAAAAPVAEPACNLQAAMEAVLEGRARWRASPAFDELLRAQPQLLTRVPGSLTHHARGWARRLGCYAEAGVVGCLAEAGGAGGLAEAGGVPKDVGALGLQFAGAAA